MPTICRQTFKEMVGTLALCPPYDFYARPGMTEKPYFTVSAPALQATASWSPVAPLQPTAPMILPPSTSGSRRAMPRRRRVQCGDIGAGGSLHHVVEDLRRTAKTRRRAGLVLRDRHRSHLRVVHLVEIDQLTMRIDDGNRELPVARRFRGLGHDRLDDFSGRSAVIEFP